MEQQEKKSRIKFIFTTGYEISWDRIRYTHAKYIWNKGQKRIKMKMWWKQNGATKIIWKHHRCICEYCLFKKNNVNMNCILNFLLMTRRIRTKNSNQNILQNVRTSNFFGLLSVDYMGLTCRCFVDILVWNSGRRKNAFVTL